MVFVPVAAITTTGFAENIYIHGGEQFIYFFIQVALGILAVIIDALNRKRRVQSMLLTSALALSVIYAIVVLRLAFTINSLGDFAIDSEVRSGAFLPIVNVVLFAIVWNNQRRMDAGK